MWFFQFFCVIRVSWSYKLRPLTHQQIYRNTFSTCSASTQLPTEIDNVENIRTLRKLKEEKDQKRKEMLDANLAAEQADMIYRDFRDNNKLTNLDYPTRTSGTYNYGFTAQSNDVFSEDRKNGLGGSIPGGALVLAFTNFNRELGK